MTDAAPESPRRRASPGVKLLIEAGPLLVFFLTNKGYGIFAATGAFMLAIVASLAASWTLERRLPPMALFTAVFVLVFGGLTLWLDDELFIKLKPTIVNALFALILGLGLASRKLLLKVAFGEAFRLTEEGWRALTLRWIAFFVLLALVNEIVWRNFSTDAWVSFKVFGILPLTVLFSLSLVPLIHRHRLPDEGPGGEPA
jgi:intracellular septation protein